MDDNLKFLIFLDKSLLKNEDASIRELMNNFQKEQEGFSIINKDAILIHLYGSIVVPWESLKKRLPKKIMMSKIDPKEWGYFRILNHNPSHPIHKMDLRFFIRKLRNAISHNSVYIQDDKSIIFRDRDGSKIKYEWEELLKLIEKLS
jgi:hypothetical protein